MNQSHLNKKKIANLKALLEKKKVLKAQDDQNVQTNKKHEGEKLIEKQPKKVKPNTEESNSDFNLKKKKLNQSDTKVNTNNGGTSKLQQKMRDKLAGARFRIINEKLYTSKGKESFDLMKNDPNIFEEYHKGFSFQVKSWPSNPVDIIIKRLKPRKKIVVADLGCGDAKIATELNGNPHSVHSFDLVSNNELVTACDISKVPMKNGSVDVAVFSLALMGTNWIDFIVEANRIMKLGGELIIAEVTSRVLNSDEFVLCLKRCGFELLEMDNKNKMFVFYILKKTKECSDIGKDERIKLSKNLKPCIYKRR
ncbi:hypothetical protein BB559_006693 [Furculomyces boomerangus]|uniref:Ribosomal RNA-processing protein 8 n=1 Tax=Furculomyces boomerangus TaxID=61424 RepID=A0A2T9Y167_9FUNG|nr:hypothetical protein BB559_006693 [Furculomyces boomerangus]